MAHEALTQQTLTRPLSEWDGVEVLAAPEHLAAPAAIVLGWEGAVLPPAVLLGRRVVVVAELVAEAHAHRAETGWPPVTDRMSVATWSWSEMEQLAPPPAVRLRGVIAPARHWRTGLTAAVPFTGVCATALLLPADVARDTRCLRHAGHYGSSVVAAAGSSDVDPEAVDVVHTGRPRPVPSARSTLVGRWVHELVYAQLIAGEPGWLDRAPTG
ncbi:MAG: hypothetical protein ACRDRZ_02275 [Pseudonocardiaceae bacterium]